MAEYEYPFLSHSHRQVKYTRPLEEPQQDEHVQSHLAENTAVSEMGWTCREDQYLVDAILRGEGYQMISAILSAGTAVRTQEDCRNRVKELSNPIKAGGILPQLWEWSYRKVRRRRRLLQLGEIPFTNDEHIELLMWQHYGCQGLDPLAFDDERCSEELRNEAVKLTKGVDPRTLRVAVRYWRKKKSKEWRQQRGHVSPAA